MSAHYIPTTYHRRDQRLILASIDPDRPTPSRDLLAATPEAQATLDKYEELRQTWQAHIAAAVRLRAEADTAAHEYTERLKAALVSGADASKVTSEEPSLRVQAAAHDSIAVTARKTAAAAGHVAGKAIADAAPAQYGRLESELAREAAEIRATLDHLNDVWSRWQNLFRARWWLSQANVAGGPLNLVDVDGSVLPDHAGHAAATIRDALKAVDVLNADEAQVAEHRAQQRLASEYSAELRARADQATVRPLRG